MTHAHLNMLANGHDKPSMRAMELIARACDGDPSYFAEYRLAVAMRKLDPSEVGLEQALENLNARLGARRRRATRPRRPSHQLAIGSIGLTTTTSNVTHASQAIRILRRVSSG